MTFQVVVDYETGLQPGMEEVLGRHQGPAFLSYKWRSAKSP